MSYDPLHYSLGKAAMARTQEKTQAQLHVESWPSFTNRKSAAKKKWWAEKKARELAEKVNGNG